MSILVELRAAITEAFSRARRPGDRGPGWVLWLDGGREWERVLDRVGNAWDLVRYSGSQLEIRVKLEREQSDRPRLVYVPLGRDQLTVLKEYEFRGPVFEKPLLATLREWGVEVEPDDERRIRPLLPILLDRWADKALSFWRDLTVGGVLERLFGNDQVRAFLAEPGVTVAALRRDQLLEVFADYLTQRFGVDLALEADPDGAARKLVETLLVAEARSAAPDAPGFPYPDRLPSGEARDACQLFLHDWLEARNETEVAARCLERAEETVRLGSWAEGLPGFVKTEASLDIERALLRRTLAEFRNAGEQVAREEYLRERVASYQDRSRHFWARAGGSDEGTGRAREWEALATAAQLVVEARTALDALGGARNLSTMAAGYANQGYRVDLLYRRYRAAFDLVEGLEDVRSMLARLHRRVQEEVNKRFTALLEAAGSIEAVGLTDQATAWRDALDQKKRTAVLVLDAFRYELGHALGEIVRRWGGPISWDIKPILAPLPSITPLGMARLVAAAPVEDRVDEDGKWDIRAVGAPGSGLNLAEKVGRREALRSGDGKAVLLELDGLLDLRATEVPKARLVVVFSQELDAAGHAGVLDLTPRMAEDHVRRVAAAIQKLGAAGYQVVHVVTDHGFFLLDEIGDEDVIPCQAEGVRYKGHRALVAERVDTTTLVKMPFGQTELTLAVPHGVGILQARGKYEFFHGGASLQELVVPWVTVRFPIKVRAFDLRVDIAPRITSYLFDVVLRAVEPTAQKELLEGKFRPRYVELKLYRLEKGAPAGAPLATASGPECFVGEQQREKVVRMRIGEGARFEYGDAARVIAVDADAPGSELDHRDIEIHVESER
jgi:hypothetical protein